MDPSFKLLPSPESGLERALQLLDPGKEAYYQFEYEGRPHTLRIKAADPANLCKFRFSMSVLDHGSQILHRYAVSGTRTDIKVTATVEDGSGNRHESLGTPWSYVMAIPPDARALNPAEELTDPLLQRSVDELLQALSAFRTSPETRESRAQAMEEQFPELCEDLRRQLPESASQGLTWTDLVAGADSRKAGAGEACRCRARDDALGHPILAKATLIALAEGGAPPLRIGRSEDWVQIFEQSLLEVLIALDPNEAEYQRFADFDRQLQLDKLATAAEYLNDRNGATHFDAEVTGCEDDFFCTSHLAAALGDPLKYSALIAMLARHAIVPPEKPAPR